MKTNPNKRNEIRLDPDIKRFENKTSGKGFNRTQSFDTIVVKGANFLIGKEFLIYEIIGRNSYDIYTRARSFLAILEEKEN